MEKEELKQKKEEAGMRGSERRNLPHSFHLNLMQVVRTIELPPRLRCTITWLERQYCLNIERPPLCKKFELFQFAHLCRMAYHTMTFLLTPPYPNHSHLYQPPDYP